MIKTVTTTAGVNTVAFPEFKKYFWIRNIGNNAVYASAYIKVYPAADNSSVINSGEIVRVDNVDNPSIYIYGNSTIEIHAVDDPNCPFKVIKKGGDKNVQPLVLFNGTDDGYTLADGFTGFSAYYTDTPAGDDVVITQIIDDTTELKYGYRICKAFSIYDSGANYTDSAVISSNEKIDLTNYNTLCIDFHGYCDFNTSNMNYANDMAAYFRIDRPDDLPKSKNAYDWTGWDNMGMNYHKNGKYYFDVSQLTGEHYLCFGIYHGTYDYGYTNGIKMYKMALM